MDLEYIKKMWVNEMTVDLEANRTAWDSVAKDYLYDEKAGLEKDPFLQYIQNKIDWTKPVKILDVGCGAGAYSVALSSRAEKVVGVDFSPAMIQEAGKYVKQHGIQNVEYLERDWWNCSGEEFRGKFDFVFAHTTPAIADYGSLVKMMEASSRYCALCKPARRRDEVLDKLREVIGWKKQDADTSVAYAFGTVWGHGYCPELVYHDTVWKSSKSLDEAKDWYLNRLKGAGLKEDKKVEKVCNYLEEISVNGRVEDTTYTTLVTMFWEVRR